MHLLYILLFVFSYAQDCIDGVEVELWNECYNIGSTYELNLSNTGLSGEIPTEIGQLINLQGLYLYDNQLSGEIPSEIGNLTNLVDLGLGGNNLTGSIPSAIGDLMSLHSIHLGDNNLTGEIPEEIGNLFYLQYLRLWENDLTGEIPIGIGNLTNLYDLSLGHNNLTGEIPSEIGNLINLFFLNLRWNQLTGEIPPEIGNLTNLHSLVLYNNQFSGEIPPEIGNLINLESLSCSNIQLTGQIPLEIWNLVNLRVIDFWGNELYGSIPAEIGNLINLEYLWLGENYFQGEIPSEFGNLVNLQEFSLRENQLVGPIPPEIGNLVNLRLIDFMYNTLSGPIPPEITNLTLLENIWIGGTNNLTGEIPADIGNLTNLVEISFWNNNLTGEIPESIGNLTNLERLYLDENALSGQIPESICNLSLDEINISYNNLCAPYPLCIEDLVGPQNVFGCEGYVEINGNAYFEADLDVLQDIINANPEVAEAHLDSDDGDENGVIDSYELCSQVYTQSWDNGRLALLNCNGYGLHTIPESISDLSNLTNLYLEGNQLSYLPESLCQIYPDLTLSVSNNMLCYPSLECLENNLGFQYCEDCESNFSFDDICLNPDDINFLQDLIDNSSETINMNQDINNNSNVESIELGQQSWVDGRIINLDCGNQGISGNLPSSIGGASFLEELYIDNNQLSGEIPSSIGALANLERLYLHMNQLSGEIPSDIFSLTNLERLYLSYNQLYGEISSSIGALTNLERLHLNDNMLMGMIPESLCDLDINFSSGSRFKIYNNNLCPPYPDCLTEEDVGEQTCDVPGCTDPYAFNYDPEADFDDGSCCAEWGECFNNPNELIGLYYFMEANEFDNTDCSGEPVTSNSEMLMAFGATTSSIVFNEDGTFQSIFHMEMFDEEFIEASCDENPECYYLIDEEACGVFGSCGADGFCDVEVSDGLWGIGEHPLYDNEELFCMESSWPPPWICEESIERFNCYPYNYDFNLQQLTLTDTTGAILSSEVCLMSTYQMMEDIFSGCMDPYAFNYNPNATIDNGSCEYTQTGDLNDDGAVDIFDIILMVGMVIDNEPYNLLADLNTDGTIDIFDIIELVNLILND